MSEPTVIINATVGLSEIVKSAAPTTSFVCHQCDDVPCMHTPRPVLTLTVGGERLWLPLRYTDGRVEDARGQLVAENVPPEFGALLCQSAYLVLAAEKLEAAMATAKWTSYAPAVRTERDVLRKVAERARQAAGERR